MCMGYVSVTSCLLAMIFATHSTNSLPWVFPGDFRERLRMSDLVVSGTIEDTSALRVQIVDHTELAGHLARIRIDRVFQGSGASELQFTWFKYYTTNEEGVYSGPPFANFQPHKRYLIFL